MPNIMRLGGGVFESCLRYETGALMKSMSALMKKYRLHKPFSHGEVQQKSTVYNLEEGVLLESEHAVFIMELQPLNVSNMLGTVYRPSSL